MNKTIKLFIAIIGAVNVVFSVATPILLVLLILNTSGYSHEFFTPLLIIGGGIASFYRGIKFLIFPKS